MQSFAQRIERAYRVRFDEAGPDGYLPASGFLRFAQDLAWIHSESAGFGRDWYRQRGLTWLVRAVELDVLSNVPYGSELTISTEVIGLRRVWARRRSEFNEPGSERIAAIAITDWVILDGSGRPARVPSEIAELFVGRDADFTPMRLRIGEAPADATAATSSVKRAEMDPMAHMNNAAYLDYLDEHLLGSNRSARALPVPRRYRADFVMPAGPGATLLGRAWRDATTWCYRLENESGQELLVARYEVDSATWVGG